MLGWPITHVQGGYDSAMRFGISTWFWVQSFTTANLSLVEKVADAGFDWIEIPIGSIDQNIDYREVGAAIRDNGLGVSVGAIFGDDCDFVLDDPVRNQAAVAYVKHCIDAAVALGGRLVAGPLYSSHRRLWRATDRRHDLEQAARHLREVGRYANEHGVTIGIEPLNRFETSFLITADQGLELIGLVDNPAVQLMSDFFHMNIDEKDLPKAIERMGSHLVHIHACENDRGVPGAGHVPWVGIAAALKKIKYDGALVIESFDVNVQGLAEAARTWYAVVPNERQLVGEGLSFLKKCFA